VIDALKNKIKNIKSPKKILSGNVWKLYQRDQNTRIFVQEFSECIKKEKK